MDFRELWIWDYIKDDFEWYYAVANNEMPAKYLIAKRVGVDFSEDESLESLLSKLDKVTEEFLKLWKDVRYQGEDISKLEVPKRNILYYLSVLTNKWLRKCSFCRWNCKVDRVEGKKLGACQLDNESRVATFFHHNGEELVFRGTMGSGTVFFTSCNMRCAFCQNGDISTDKFNGLPVNSKELAGIMKLLRLEGVHNINLVGGEPTIHLHVIVDAIRRLANGEGDIDNYKLRLIKADGFYPIKRERALYKGEINVPMLWNSNFFMSDNTMNVLRLLMDIWLPDFKYGNNKCALKLSRTPWYVETVTKNLLKLKEWKEEAVIRHLIMPNHVEDDTIPVLDWIAKNMPEYWINIMDQYHPDNFADPNSEKFDPKYSDIARYPTREEIQMAWSYAKKLGIKFDIITFERAKTL